MLRHLIAIVGLALLCGAWVAFQGWLRRVDPNGRHIESGAGGCGGGGHCQTPAPERNDSSPSIELRAD
ncbi:hypothetical protein G3480_15170 [Thiorhodococcus mannitoliphagus]|uniref:Uncharacterized protein n=1 Tax=Thiorhodococcus mannitoliphagus TaxID=329406 RepID=A0A6P1E0W9_9GAMM|nr:hypothetical protein [Thiorhodococcus mannitoliphagus]NEX21634.1 hypothetical protein [Thiorhodococcus mannitoliphagus]